MENGDVAVEERSMGTSTEPEPPPEHIKTDAEITSEDMKESKAALDLEEPEESQTNGKYCLQYFMSAMFAAILEDTIVELRILSECNNELRIHKIMSDIVVLRAIKFGVEQPVITDELANVNPHKLESEEYKLIKLDADRKYLADVIVSTYTDLSVNMHFTSLLRSIDRVIQRNEHRIFLMDDETKNRIQSHELNRQIRHQRNHIKSSIYDADVTIEMLKNRVEDAVLNAETQMRYVINWQHARTEQHLLVIKLDEDEPMLSTDYYKQRSDHEQRVHAEVELLNNIFINETLEKVEQWMNKYDKDMEAIDLRIQIKKNDYQNMLDKRVDLEDTLEKHDTLMKEWIQFKEDREKARLYREKMTKSAITVQAWWRGLLVRRQLGPYKVAKKKGAKKK